MKKTLLLLAFPILALGIFASTSLLQAEGAKVQILKFEADWCGPCQQMIPVFNKVSKRMSNHATFTTINVDDQPSVADSYQVRGLPTVIAVRDGRELGRNMGFMNSRQLKAFVKRHK